MRKPEGLQGSIGLILLGMVLILSANTATCATTSGIRINEVLFNPGDGAYQWVELKNSGTAAVNIGGYRITNETGAWYTIPAALPAVPSGAFVVVVFDGAGSGTNDYDFSDKVATLHSGPELVNILGRSAGQCALYDSSPFKLFLPGILSNFQGTKLSTFSPPSAFLPPVMPSYDAWSDPSNDRASGASKARLWSKRMLKSLARELGAGLSSLRSRYSLLCGLGSRAGELDHQRFQSRTMEPQMVRKSGSRFRNWRSIYSSE